MSNDGSKPQSSDFEQTVKELEKQTGKKYTILKAEVLPADRSKIYMLDDAFTTDPFQWFLEKSKGMRLEYNAYVDYLQYFGYLAETWKRLQEEYRMLWTKGNEIPDEMFSMPEPPAPVKEYFRTAKLIQLDTEVFIMFSNRFMDKVGKLIERIIKLDDTEKAGSTFAKHKNFFIRSENEHYNPKYSEYLKNNTSWYELLSIMRDKVIEHGGRSFNDSLYISQTHGIMHIKENRVEYVSAEDQKTLFDIRKRYPQLSNVHQDQPWRILRAIMKDCIPLSEQDFKEVAAICQRTGGSLNADGISKYIERFLDDTSKIVKP